MDILFRLPRFPAPKIAGPMLTMALITAVACGSGLNISNAELKAGPTPELPAWATQDRLISVNRWADRVVEGPDGVRFIVTQVVGSTDGLFQIFYEVEGRTKEIPTRILIRTGDVYLDTVEISQSFDADGYLETGKWKFPGAVSVVGLFDDTVIELYE